MSLMTFEEGFTKYFGRKERTAVVYVAGVRIDLGLADTARCAASLENSTATAANLYKRAGQRVEGDAGILLRDFCRQMTGWKERVPRY